MSGPEPRWLTDEEQHTWRYLAGLMITLPAALDNDLHTTAGISHFDFLVLSTLSEAAGHTMRMSDLAAHASSSLSRLSHVVSRLEKHGWVRREPCPDDGRYTNALLTDAGMDKVVNTAPGHVEAVRRMVFDGLGAEQSRALRAIASQILARVKAQDSRNNPGAAKR